MRQFAAMETSVPIYGFCQSNTLKLLQSCSAQLVNNHINDFIFERLVWIDCLEFTLQRDFKSVETLRDAYKFYETLALFGFIKFIIVA